MEMQQELDLDRLHTLLHGCAVGHTVDYRRSVESTMPPAHELAQDAAVRAGHIVTTEQQTSGKGRRGRSWDAPYAQGVLVSVVLTPPLLPGDPARIPMAAGLAVADTLLEAVPELAGTVSLKWPNDVLLGSGSSTGKVAGILVESAFESDALKYAVLGIGVNVNQRPAQFPEVAAHMVTPVSLRSFLGRRVDRTDLLAILCTQLAARFAADESRGDMFQEWRSRLSTLGQRVSVYVLPQAGRATVTGMALDVTAAGDLLVEDSDGALHTFTAADVSVRAET